MSGDSVQITYLGHAGLRIDGADLRLLMDPWLSRTGAFQAAWYQFPANAHLDQPSLLDLTALEPPQIGHPQPVLLCRLQLLQLV